MREFVDEFEEKGARIVAIGMGIPAMAANFKEENDISFLLLVDQEQRTYKSLELERSLVAAAGPQVWWKGAKSILKGHGVARAEQDWQQLGGAMVVAKGGRVLFVHRAETSSDNAPVDRLLEAIS